MIPNRGHDDLYAAAIKRWGIDFQILMAIEEMAELTQQLVKWQRGHSNPSWITEEIADVAIMLEQLLYWLEKQSASPCLAYKGFNEQQSRKANRLRRLLEEDQ